MPSLYKSAAALAMAGAAFANPMDKRYSPDQCLAAVTGKAALGDDNLRKEHCSSFFKTIVTPAAVTVTTTITDKPDPSNLHQWKRDVTVCPNEVPNYASACDEAGYKSACNAWGIEHETTITIPASTTTKTVYFGRGGGKDGVCTSTTTVTKTGEKGTATVYSTVTETAAVSTITSIVTVGGPSGTGSHPSGTSSTSGSPPFPSGRCLSDDKAKEFTDAFKNLLEYTNLGSAATNNGPYNRNISQKYLAEDFQDYSDSINWMAKLPLGGVTFPSRDIFDSEQGDKQFPLVVSDVLRSHSCKDITWKWSALTNTGVTVVGINYFIINDELTQIKENHAEFNNGAWIQSFSMLDPSINCKTPTIPSGGASGNGTAPAGRRL